jgi:hypothetical protein
MKYFMKFVPEYGWYLFTDRTCRLSPRSEECPKIWCFVSNMNAAWRKSNAH